MNERQREELLEKVHRTGTTVGRSIPETVEFDGDRIPLCEVFFELAGRDSLSGEDEKRLNELLCNLRRERLRLVQRIERGDIDHTRGKEIVRIILELDRAINAFESLAEPGLEEQIRRQQIASAQELVDLMRSFGLR